MRTFKIKLNDTITGLTNTSWDPDNIVSGRAATEDQLKLAAKYANPMSSMYMDDGKALTYYVDEGEEVQTYLDRILNAQGGSSVYPGLAAKTVTYSTSDYTWTGIPDNDGNESTTPDALKVTFPDNSTLEKHNVTFKRHYSVPDRVYAASLGNGARYVDTGLTMNYRYTFVATCRAPQGQQGVPVGAFASTSERTTIRILGGSDKMNLCWSNLVERTAASITCNAIGTGDFSFRRMCTIVASGQNEPKYIDYRISGSTGNNEGCSASDWGIYMSNQPGENFPPIYLFNEQPNDQYRYIVLREVMIYDENYTLIRMYQPAKINNEIVIVEALTGNILRPNAGTLVEVTE